MGPENFRYVDAGEKSESAQWARTAAAWERRDKFPLIMRYLRSPQEARVCVVYGLRRTGKTTMLMQAVNALSPEEFDRAAYVKASVQATMRDMDAVLRGLEQEGVRWRNVEEFLCTGVFRCPSPPLLSIAF